MNVKQVEIIQSESGPSVCKRWEIFALLVSSQHYSIPRVITSTITYINLLWSSH